jgi:imidazoleglycerol-phosphate dehydratase
MVPDDNVLVPTIPVTANYCETMMSRSATVSRTTGETDVQVTINLDGTGQCDAQTGCRFWITCCTKFLPMACFDLDRAGQGRLRN